MAAEVLEDKVKKDEDIGNLLDGMKSMSLNSNVKECLNIPLWLKNCESPFHWHTQLPRAHTSEYMIERCLEKLSEINFDEPSFSLRRYSVLLKLLLEYSITQKKVNIDETMDTLKKSIEQYSAEGNLQYQKVQVILDHVMCASEAYLLAQDGKEEMSKKIAQDIVPVKEMSNSNNAGLLAVKANFFLYSGYEESENTTVELAREAHLIEPENHEWLFLLAKVLRQQRRDVPFNSDIPKEELLLLEKAVKMCHSSKYLEYLAQVYRESAAQAHKQYRNTPNYFSSDLRKVIEDMQHKSLVCYKEALELEPNNAGNLRRIGYGIMNLPVKIADYDLASKCLLKSLDLCYNINTLHIIGTFYHRYRKDNKKALEYFEKTANAGSHAGLSDMIRVKFLENPRYDPCEDIEKGLQKETKIKNRIFLLTQKSGYFLFIKRNFLTSIDSFNQAISESNDSKQITVYKCIFLRMFDPINLFEYMANEAFLYIQQNKSTSEEEDNDDNIYKVMALIDTITNLYPVMDEIDPDPHLIDNLCKSSKEIQQKEKLTNRPHRYEQNKSNYEGGQFQQRGTRGSSGRGGRSETCGNWRGRGNQSSKWGGNQRNDETVYERAEEERSGRFSGNSMGQRQYPNREKQRKFRSDEDRNWRKK